MNHRYHPEALEEYEEAIGYYQEKAGLGDRFSNVIADRESSFSFPVFDGID